MNNSDDIQRYWAARRIIRDKWSTPEVKRVAWKEMMLIALRSPNKAGRLARNTITRCLPVIVFQTSGETDGQRKKAA